VKGLKLTPLGELVVLLAKGTTLAGLVYVCLLIVIGVAP